MPKVSVIVPVFNAEKTLRKCVESIIFGKEKDIEVVLVEDHSKDNSWDLCLRLSKEYSQVKRLRNERNSGVSHTRNRGLQEASGQYVMFVDSDDWVSGHYASSLIETQVKHPNMLCICEICFLDYSSGSRQIYGLHRNEKKLYYFSPSEYFDLVDAVLLQSPCNKLFALQVIRETGICFDETISMGEDFQFVIDYLKAASCEGCLVVNQPLYYYIKCGNTSLMSQWGDLSSLEKSIGRLRSLKEICGDQATPAFDNQICKIRNQYALKIAHNRSIGRSEKLKRIEYVMQDGNATSNYLRYKKILLRERLATTRSSIAILFRKVSGKIRYLFIYNTIRNAKKRLLNQEITIISQDYIDGVFYHDLGLRFLSPTINTFIPEPGFVKFVLNLRYYMEQELVMRWGEEYPIGMLDDVEVHFMHYETCKEAKESWENRKARINWDKIFVIATDRNGFDDVVFEDWKKISYPKILFTAQKKYASEADSVYFPEYEGNGFVPDLIPNREFYKDGILVNKVNHVGGHL